MTGQAKHPGPWPGRFVWHNLMTRDAARAEAFYTELFDWQIVPVETAGDVHRVIQIGAGPIGGIIEEPGISHAHWMPFLATADVDAAATRCRELGGSVSVDPTDVPGTGRFAVVTDVEGAVFTLFCGVPNRPGADPELRVPGRVCWNELWSKDTSKALAFYAGMFGWQSEDMPMEPMGVYHMQTVGDSYTGGIMNNPEPDTPVCWTQYFEVEDLAESTQRAEELGGKKCAGPIEVPGMGNFTLITDPTGAMLALFEAAAAE